LGDYLNEPGDGRSFPQIPGVCLLWSLLLGKVLRVSSLHGLEDLVRMAPGAMGVGQRFGDDALAYFMERLSAPRLRQALAGVVRRSKRNKVFENSALLGLALDGTGAGRSAACRCALCHRQGNGYGHKFSALSVVGGGLDLPFDVEPYGPGEGELTASKRLLERAMVLLGSRFADYVVVDGLYAGTPFIELAESLGLSVVVALNDNIAELHHAARDRFGAEPPAARFEEAGSHVEVWDAEDFEPWGHLTWSRVRVVRYRQVRSDGKTFEAFWVTSFSAKRVGPRALYRICKSRWAIENHGFNDAKNRYGLGHIAHHEAHSILIHALLTCLALCVERLYRLRYLRRGTHRALSAVELWRRFWISLGAPEAFDTS
jgi:hypothetical protein